jgi:uncharacterized protein involved in exopolysaccharide biosynthesis
MREHAAQLIWSKRRFLLQVTLGSLFISTLITILLPKRYVSETRLIAPGRMNSTALVIGLLQSRTIQDRLIDRFDLKSVYGDRTWEDTRKDLEKHSAITVDNKHGVIAIRVRDGSSDRAVAMVQGYTNELNLLIIQLDTASAHRERLFLENMLARGRQDLETSQKELSAFASNNLIIDMGAETETMIDVPGAEQGKSIVEEAEQESERSIYTDDSIQDPISQPIVVAPVTFAIKAAVDGQNKLIGERAALQSLKSTYADSNVRVRTLQAIVGRFRRGLEELVGESSLTARQDQRPLYPSLRDLPLLLESYVDLSRTVRKNASLFGTFAQEYESAKIAEVRDTPSITVLDPANLPEYRSWPSRILIISLSAFCCFSIAVAWIVGTVSWQRWPEDEWKLFAIEVSQTIRAYFQIDGAKS